MLIDPIFLLAAIVAHPLHTAEHGRVPVEPLVLLVTLLSLGFVPPIDFRVVDRGETPPTALRVDHYSALRALIEHVL